MTVDEVQNRVPCRLTLYTQVRDVFASLKFLSAAILRIEERVVGQVVHWRYDFMSLFRHLLLKGLGQIPKQHCAAKAVFNEAS